MIEAPTLEKELVRKLRTGSIEAFDALYYRYEKRLYAFSYKTFGNAEDAEEVVQEVFFKIWKRRHLLDEEKSFKSFIFTVAKNHMYSLLSKRVSESAYRHYYEGTAQRHSTDTEDSVHFHELQQMLDRQISNMPEKRKQVLQLSRMDGLSNSEIAQRMNISLSTVENHINKALKTLRQQLSIHKPLLISLILILIS